MSSILTLAIRYAGDVFADGVFIAGVSGIASRAPARRFRVIPTTC
jgi:hypothetical protein